jgi:hypothetical protein
MLEYYFSGTISLEQFERGVRECDDESEFLCLNATEIEPLDLI